MRQYIEGRRQRYLVSLFTIIILLISFVGIVSATSQTAGSYPSYASDSKVMAEFVEMTNELRAKVGLGTLAASQELEFSANNKLQNMEELNYWGHYGPNNEAFSKFIWRQKPNSTLAGENLARCFANHKEAFIGLVNSPTHYAVLTGDFKEVGIASQTTNYGCESIVMHFSD